jgi:hypothetical protein
MKRTITSNEKPYRATYAKLRIDISHRLSTVYIIQTPLE